MIKIILLSLLQTFVNSNFIHFTNKNDKICVNTTTSEAYNYMNSFLGGIDGFTPENFPTFINIENIKKYCKQYTFPHRCLYKQSDNMPILLVICNSEMAIRYSRDRTITDRLKPNEDHRIIQNSCMYDTKQFIPAKFNPRYELKCHRGGILEACRYKRDVYGYVAGQLEDQSNILFTFNHNQTLEKKTAIIKWNYIDTHKKHKIDMIKNMYDSAIAMYDIVDTKFKINIQFLKNRLSHLVSHILTLYDDTDICFKYFVLMDNVLAKYACELVDVDLNAYIGGPATYESMKSYNKFFSDYVIPMLSELVIKFTGSYPLIIRLLNDAPEIKRYTYQNHIPEDHKHRFILYDLCNIFVYDNYIMLMEVNKLKSYNTRNMYENDCIERTNILREKVDTKDIYINLRRFIYFTNMLSDTLAMNKKENRIHMDMI